MKLSYSRSPGYRDAKVPDLAEQANPSEMPCRTRTSSKVILGRQEGKGNCRHTLEMVCLVPDHHNKESHTNFLVFQYI